MLFKCYPMGYLHIDITEPGRLRKAYLFIAIDRTTKFVNAELFEPMSRKNAIDFLQAP